MTATPAASSAATCPRVSMRVVNQNTPTTATPAAAGTAACRGTRPPRGRARVLDELAVAIDWGDLLLGRNAGRIRTGGRDVVTVALGNLAGRAPQLHEPLDRLVRALARLRRELDYRCVQLGLQRARQTATGRSRNEYLDCRHELACLRIEDPELFLDADGQGAPEVLFDQLALTPWTWPPAASHA